MIEFRWIALPLQILDDARLQAADVRIAAILLCWTRQGEGVIKLSNLARRARCPESDARASIDRLVVAGFVTITESRRSNWGENMLAIRLTLEDDRSEAARARARAIGGAA